MNEVSPNLLRCQCTQQLLPYLSSRRIVTPEEDAWISSQPICTEGMVTVLKKNVCNSKMIEGLYLALMDCVEELQNIWCHRVATARIRLAGTEHIMIVYTNVVWTLNIYNTVMSQLEANINFYGEQTKRAGCNSISACHINTFSLVSYV